MNAGNTKVVAMLLPVTTKKEIIRISDSTSKSKELRREPWYVDMMFTALHKKDGIALLTLLKEYGADFNVKNEYGSTLLNEAVYALPSFSDIRSTMDDLVRAGYGARHMGQALENTQNQLIENSEKHLKDELKMLDFLFANGADPRIGGRDGQTPLALLIQKKDLNHLEKAAEMVMDLFVKHGANVNAVDDHGLTPLHEAASSGDLVAIEYLINQGAAVNSQSIRKCTPLHCAASCGNALSTKLLLEKGADFTMQEEDGLDPLVLSSKAMANDKKLYRFSSQAAEREFESKYIAVINVIVEFTLRPKSNALKKHKAEPSMAALARQGATLHGTSKQRIIIFLDIDGVLFSNNADGSVQRRVKERYETKGMIPPKHYSKQDADEAAVDLFDKNALANLDVLIKKIDENGYEAGIVLSSSWRTKGDIGFLSKLFEQHNFSKYIIGKTIDEKRKDISKPDPFAGIRGKRALEIKHWLDTKGSKVNVTDYIVLDDVDFHLKETYGNKFIHCNQKNDLFSEDGLSQALNSLGFTIPMVLPDDEVNKSMRIF